MSRILHLSDLHLGSDAPEQAPILDALIAAVRAVREGGDAGDAPIELIAVTGDVFDSATLPAAEVIPRAVACLDGVVEAAGGDAALVVVPGNHDRRRRGLIAPHRGELFLRLRDALRGRAWVAGCETPFLASVVPRDRHRLRACVVAYDSTYLPRGMLSAGGVVRQEDLLRAAAAIADEPSEYPILFLLHHHLVPTPLTDLGVIESPKGRILRFGLERVLPRLIANADREELTMTALGAGTALSTLHAMGRAVLVLHGHKHYATARLLRHMFAGHGDVLIVSAGSAGMAEPWSPAGAGGDVARLWPSFNLLHLDDEELHVETVSFGYKGSSSGRASRRSLVRAHREDRAWSVEPVHVGGTREGSAEAPSEEVRPRLLENESIVTLAPSAIGPSCTWDLECHRRIRRAGASPRRYHDHVEGSPGARIVRLSATGAALSSDTAPARFEIDLDAGEARYRLENGVCRTVAEAERIYGDRTSPYEWIGLMNRYACDAARLVLRGLGPASRTAFGSVTDLGTGLEEPARLAHAAGDELVLAVDACGPRTLLRIYWPLAEAP